jgi:hypothetical protein
MSTVSLRSAVHCQRRKINVTRPMDYLGREYLHIAVDCLESLNTFLKVIILVIPALLFIVFLWFLISPLLRDKTVAAGRSKDVDTEGLRSIEDQYEKASLLNWMRRSSRGRFADVAGNHKPYNVNQPTQGKSEDRRFSFSTLFVRNSLVPHIVSVTVTPPPIYTATIPNAKHNDFAPTVSSPLACAPLECVPPEQGRLTVPRIFVPARRISLRSISGPSPTMSSFRPQMAARSVSDAETTRLPSSSTNARLPSWLPIPSKALVLARESPGSNVGVRMPAMQTRTDAGLPIGKIA